LKSLPTKLFLNKKLLKSRLMEDLQNEAQVPLIDEQGDTRPSLLHLILFGKASPYLHNGTNPVIGEDGQVSISPT